MADVPTKQTLLEFLVVSQLEAIKRQEQTLRTLPASTEYLDKAQSLRSEIAASVGRAERLSRLIDPMQQIPADQWIAA